MRSSFVNSSHILRKAGLWFAIANLLAGAFGQRVITTIAGGPRIFRGENGPATEASLGPVARLTIDKSGNVYAADRETNLVVKVSADGVLTVIAGNGIRGFSGDGGPATNAALDQPTGVDIDSSGNLYIADTGNHRIRKVDSSGAITTVAGSGESGFAGDGGLAVEAQMTFPTDVAVDLSGNLYIADSNNQRIRRVTTDGVIRTVAGNGEIGFSGDGGPATQAALSSNASGVAIGAAGSFLIADAANNRVRRVGPDGVISTIAGNGSFEFSGDGGPAVNAGIFSPGDVFVDAVGNILIADSANHRMRKVAPNGVISTIAGSGIPSFSGDGGPALEAGFFSPRGVASDTNGNIFVADGGNDRIRQIRADGSIRTFAGNGRLRFAGDGGLAVNAALNRPSRLSFGSDGHLLLIDQGNGRIREIDKTGIIRTVAGDRTSGFSGDGGPAVDAAFGGPQGLTADSAGSFFIADTGNLRVRRVGPDGVVQTVAGNGDIGFSGDGGPALQARLSPPADVAVDASGNLFIADTTNQRIRRVDATGTIKTAAGDGQSGYAGDGGPANRARLFNPAGVAIDNSGRLLIADTQNDRVRRVESNGVITTVAGTGQRGSGGDGGPATAAQLRDPHDIDTAPGGELLIVDRTNSRIREVGLDGVIRTLAGNGERAFSGDGGPGTEAALSQPRGIAVDSANNVFIADFENDRIRAVLAEPPAFPPFDIGELRLTAPSGGAPVRVEPVLVRSAVEAMTLSASAVTNRGGDWLSIDPKSGSTPRLLRLTADPVNLAPGTYQGIVAVKVPLGNPPERRLRLLFSVTPPLPPELAVDATGFSFTFAAGGQPQSQAFLVLNRGSGGLAFSIEAQTNLGGGWLTVSPQTGIARPGAPAQITVTANPRGLTAGTYTGRVLVKGGAAGEIAIPVTMTVSATDRIILLSQTGMSFTVVEDGGLVAPQSFGVLNLGRGPMSWSAKVTTLEGGAWLAASPANGTSEAGGVTPFVNVSIRQAGLVPKTYYGLIEVSAEGAANSPQPITVALEVLPRDADPGASLGTNELLFSGVGGQGSPGSQDVLLYNVTAQPKSFRAVASTNDGGNWLRILPSTATLDPAKPTRLVAQPIADGLGAGVYRGQVSLQFSDGRVSTVEVVFVVAEAAPAASAVRALVSGCTPSRLVPVVPTLPEGFSVSGGWPVALRVNVSDDCGNPMEEGTVAVVFNNGDPQLFLEAMKSGQGRWDGTWETNSMRLSDVTLRVEASQPSLGISGVKEVTGGLRSVRTAPALPAAGVTTGASFQNFKPFAPGGLISLFGLQLSEGTANAESLPLPNVLAGTTVLIDNTPVPLLFTSNGQVNAVIPLNLAENTQHRLYVRRGLTYSYPVPIDLGPAQPEIFKASAEGSQGHVYKFIPGAAALRADALNPVTAGDVIIIYCTGLGKVDPPVEAGQAAPENPLSRTVLPVTLRVGGVPANVFFAGLAPGFSGLYQINAFVPALPATGDAVPVVVEVAGQQSPEVTIGVR